MTKVRDLTRQIEGEEKKLKPIEFCFILNSDEVVFEKSKRLPNSFDYIDRIQESKDNYFKMDLFTAYDKGDKAKLLYLGHFNDGVVE